MPRDRQTIGSCPRCNRGPVTCSYNRFANETREIHSWEHRCPDCGHRETAAFRSDDIDPKPAAEATVCPFCGRPAAAGI
jgi:ssDNA-binding Zn-finger/Zn-ribbon topoisomerase 1